MSGSDPFEENAPPPAALATTYQRQAGEMMVYGGTFFGLFFLLGGVMSGTWGLFALSAAMLGAAFYFYPMIRTERAQLRVESKGFFLDGLGWLPWTAIREVRMYDRSVRTIRNAHLELTLTAPADDMLMDADRPDAVRVMMAKTWSLKKGPDGSPNSKVVVRLEPLKATPEEILAAIRRYLPRI